MIKILAVRYPTSVDRINNNCDNLRSVHQVNENEVKQMFQTLLFDANEFMRYNYCLVKYKNKLYMIEPLNYSNCEYARRIIEYHPLEHMLNT